VKGYRQFKEEQKEDADDPEVRNDRGYCRRMQRNLAAFLELMGDNARAVIGVVVIWFLVLLSTMHQFERCSTYFFIFLISVFVGLILLTFLAAQFVVRDHAERTARTGRGVRGKGSVEWGAQGIWMAKYPAMAFGAGLLGGLLGLGGGVVLSPVLLELDMHAESVQATTSVFVLLSSSLAVVQYSMLDVYTWHQVVWFCSIAIVGTLIGQALCELIVRRYKRFSMITFSVAAIIMLSMGALMVIGFYEITASYPDSMGFHVYRFCHGNRDDGEQGILQASVPRPRETLMDSFVQIATRHLCDSAF